MRSPIFRTAFRTAAALLLGAACTTGPAIPGNQGTGWKSPVPPSQPPGYGNPTPPTPPAGTTLPVPQTGPGPAPVPYQHYDVNHVLSTGQSNAVSNQGVPVLTTTQPFANVMFDVGIIPGGLCDGEGCKVYRKPSTFAPLVEGSTFFGYPVETMSSGLANEIARLAQSKDAAHAVLVSLHGRSGNEYGCLRKGGCDYMAGYLRAFDDGMLEVGDAMALAKAAGKSYVVRAVTAIHGESDHYSYTIHQQEFPLPGTDGTSVIHDYREALLEWQRDYESSVKAITGQKEPVPLFISQMDNWTDSPHSEVTQWQYEAHVTSQGKVILVGPGYPLEWGPDCLHYSSVGERRLGEYFAKAYARVVIEGLPWEPVRPKSVSISGNVITVRYLVPKPPLVLDTDRVKDPGNYGFEYWDETAAPPAIVGVALTGPDTIEIRLATTPTGADRHVRYAFTAAIPTCPGASSGPRGNVRDSDDTTSNYGYELFNWGVHFDVAIR